jgi:hypothetical protein
LHQLERQLEAAIDAAGRWRERNSGANARVQNIVSPVLAQTTYRSIAL